MTEPKGRLDGIYKGTQVRYAEILEPTVQLRKVVKEQNNQPVKVTKK